MIDFLVQPFAIAGAIAAAGPIVIHLLNRRRFRTISWGAMNFLRQAMQRNRRILQLRDLLLLLLRCLIVLCIGLALAQPFFRNSGNNSLLATVWPWVVGVGAIVAGIWAVVAATKSMKIVATAVALFLTGFAGWGVYQNFRSRAVADSATNSRQPVHAVLVIDNSLSMAYETLEGDLLDRAQARAAEFIDQLPSGSRISVIPTSGASKSFSLDAYRNKDDARDAVGRIEVVDQSASVSTALALAAEACDRLPELAAKRVVLFGDQQASGWPVERAGDDLKQLPELQVVQVAPEEPQNVWVSEFRLASGVADIETPSTFIVELEHSGTLPLEDLQVTLSLDGMSVASQSIDLEPGQRRQVEFKYQIDIPAEPGRPQFVTAEVLVETPTVDGDRLKRDNSRSLNVPVVAGLPVVFVDTLGSKENVASGEVGETYPLRRYLAPKLSRDEYQRQLIDVRHLTIDQVDIAALADARLVVVAGLESPGAAVEMLREFVQQGGALVLTAGGDFDPAIWTQLAWNDGAGILPVPLAGNAFGETPEQLELQANLDSLKLFHLDYSTMQHPYFVLENEDDEFLSDWYRQTLFFKAAIADTSEEVLTRLLEADRKRLSDVVATTEDDSADDATNGPRWLLWAADRATELPRSAEAIESTARQMQPRVLAAFDVTASEAGSDPLPFLVERKVGAGRVLFFSSGVYSSWNTLSGKNSNIGLFDRILRRLIEETLPERNFNAGERIVLPVSPDRRFRYTLDRPDGETESLTVEALGGDQFGVDISNADRAGVYQLVRTEGDGSELDEASRKQVTPLVVNAPLQESEMVFLDEAKLAERFGSDEGTPWHWVGPGERITTEGAEIQGRNYWQMFVLLAIVGLLAEMLILAWPHLRDWQTGEQPVGDQVKVS